jgi:glycosyltransferase involved in cell wall biosynthesis
VKKISIITVVRDRAKTISNAISSLKSQDYKNVEHIIVDGGSTDGTLGIIASMKLNQTILISEVDKGIYDALNKGIKLASGDVIGILHSDDYYPHPKVLSKVMELFNIKELDALYGDANYFDSKGSLVRKYSSRRFSPKNFKYGSMMAHTALFLRRSLHQEVGYYNIDYKIAGDFEFIIRMFSQIPIKYTHIEEVLMNMTIGGESNRSIFNRFKISAELMKACQDNGIQTSHLKLARRYTYKIFEYSFVNKFYQF